jgi:SAM-dependent methyltransferase
VSDAYIEWKGWNESEFGTFGPDDARYFTAELKASGIDSLHGLTVAELGYGNGVFAGWARSQGAHWIGREVNPELLQRATRAGYDVIPAESQFSRVCGDGKLDLLVAFDVLEHLDVDAIREFLFDAERVLRPTGLLLFRLPSGDSPFSGAMYRGDVTHKTLLGSSAIRQLAEQAALEVHQIRSPVLPVRGYTGIKLLRRLSVLSVRASVFYCIRLLLMGNSNAIISPNLFAVLQKPFRAP